MQTNINDPMLFVTVASVPDYVFFVRRSAWVPITEQIYRVWLMSGHTSTVIADVPTLVNTLAATGKYNEAAAAAAKPPVTREG